MGAVRSLAGAYIDAGRFFDAVLLLVKTNFTAGEVRAALGLYRKAHLGLAQIRRLVIISKLQSICRSDIPKNFGGVRPALNVKLNITSWHNSAKAAGQHDQADHW